MRLSVLLMTPLLTLTACQDKDPKDKKEASGIGTTQIKISNELIRSQSFVTDDQGIEGRRLAMRHCQRCHLFVEPEALPGEIWEEEILPRMAAFMGMHHAGVKTTMDLGKTTSEKQQILDAGIYPPIAEMTPRDWQVLVSYYLKEAPESLEKTVDRVQIAPATELFQEALLGYKQHEPNTTLVHIDEKNRRLFIGDMTTNQLSVLNADLVRIQKIQTSSAPVHAEIRDGDLWMTHIGSVNPSDLPSGGLDFLEMDGDYFSNKPRKILSGLRRPTHASYADLNQDGLTDIIVSEHGNQLGALNYYKANKDRSYQKLELMKEPGSMISHVRDFNNDGWMDLAVVLGQNREGVHIHYNKGDGSFVPSYALPVPPHYGSSSFSPYDFNQDGYPDILATNGDNGDYRAILKPFHGVRIYLNDGKNAFTERFFFPMNGAYKALAEDFDLDGDLDIAAISMFPDFEERPEEGFVYLENQGNLSFKASTIRGVEDGRWMCMDTGDLDGDGDKDIVIGSFIRGPSEVPSSLLKTWETGNLPGLVLWNKTKQAAETHGDSSLVQLDPASAAEHHRLGLTLHEIGREAEAIKHLEEAARLNPEDPETQSSYGIALLGKGEMEQAIKLFQKALELQPGNPTFHNNLGVSFHQQRNYLAAIENYHKSLSIEPDWTATTNNLGNSLQELAYEVMGQRLDVENGQPDPATMHAVLGNSHRDQSNFIAAAMHYQWALELNPDLPPALNNLAWIRATHPDKKMRDGPLAVELAERCCKLTNYQLKGTLDTLAAAYAETGRFDDAIRWQSKAIELAGNDANASELKDQLRSYKAGKPLRK